MQCLLWRACTSLSLSLSLSLSPPYICKHGLDPDQIRMVFRIECFVNLKMCACDKSTQSVNTVLCPTLPYKSRFGYRVLIGSWLTDPNIVFRYSKKTSQNKRFVCKHRAVSLSLSLSLSLSTILLRPAIKVCKLIQKIIQCAWSGANKHTKSYNLVRLCVRWSRNISDKYLLSDACHGRIQREDRGSDPLKNHKI